MDEQEQLFNEDLIAELGMATIKAVKKASPKPKSITLDTTPALVVEQFPKYSAYERIKAKKIEWLKETLEAIFPDNWDLQIEYSTVDNSTKVQREEYIQSVNEEKETFGIKRDRMSAFQYTNFTVYIRFPEVTVKDNRKTTHKMRDVYIKMPFYYNLGLERPTLARGVKTYTEYINQYNFSHARTSGDGSFRQLCFGSTHLDTDIMSLGLGWDEIKLESILHQWQDYLSWESSEGGPYFNISSLVAKNQTSRFLKPSDDEMKEYYRSFIEIGFDSLPLNMISTGKVPDLQITTGSLDLWRALTTAVPDDYRLPYDEVLGKTFVEQHTDPTIKREIAELNKTFSKQSALFNFNGNPVKLRIQEHEAPKTDKERLAHESIRDYITTKLAREINKHYLNDFRSKHSSKENA